MLFRAWCLLIGLILCWDSLAAATDWPMWRGDAGRTGTTSESISGEFAEQWSRKFPANHIAWAEDSRLYFDAVIQPVVAGQHMYVPSSMTNSLTAVSTRTGSVVWKVFVDAPIRFAPVVWRDQVLFGADDGCIHSLDRETGDLQWKLEVAPGARWVLGNERLGSVVPIRGGPVLDGDVLHFAAGVWPFEGTYLASIQLDAEQPTIEKRLIDDYVPQGHLAFANQRIFVPGGRAIPYCWDQRSHARLQLKYDSRGRTDHHVVVSQDWVMQGLAVFHIAGNEKLSFAASRPVADGSTIYFAEIGKDEPSPRIVATDVAVSRDVKTQDRRGKEIVRKVYDPIWNKTIPDVPEGQSLRVYLKTHDFVFAAAGSEVIAVRVADQEIVWRHTLSEPVGDMLAADHRLFVVGQQGTVWSFGEQQEPPADGAAASSSQAAAEPVVAGPASSQISWADSILSQTHTRSGYAVVWGAGTGDVAEHLAQNSDLYLLIAEPDPQRAAALRRRLDARGNYGTRASVVLADPREIRWPPYVASLMLTEEPQRWQLQERQVLQRAYEVLRPYGGSLVVRAEEGQFADWQNAVQAAELTNAEVSQDQDAIRVARIGALPGAADWTHEYGDASNTLMSFDDRVRAPLGVLWFGGPSSSGELYFNRHYWAPGMTVVEGRMLIQGPERLASIDIYTGRVLWKKQLRTGSGPGRRGTFFEVEKPGFHFVADARDVFLVYPEKVLRLDPETGEERGEYRLPGDGDRWGKVRLWEDLLIATIFRDDQAAEKPGKPGQDQVVLRPLGVTALNRDTGETVWSVDMPHTAPLVAIGGDKVYLFEGRLEGFYDAWRRRGLVPKAGAERFLTALQARTGEPVWQRKQERVVTWLAYSPDHDVLVSSSKTGIETFQGGDGKELWKSLADVPGFGGHPENVWDKVILSDDRVIDQRGPGRAYNLLTGETIRQSHPVTGKEVDWQFTKTGHHCNYAIASPHLLTFRADTAGFFDRHSNATARLKGFRSGCRNSLIPAGGVLNAPNYAHGCVCAYHLFTSLALVHVPEAEMWTYNALPQPDARPRRLAINFGAPGDRLAENGTLWMEHPRRRDPSAHVEVAVEGQDLKWFLESTREYGGAQPKWVGASGVMGVESVRITLPGQEADPAARYRVRLYFAEPQASGVRQFTVKLQGQSVLEDFDILSEAGEPRFLVVKEFPAQSLTDELRLNFESVRGVPLLCGVELIAE